jgi:peroxiredoxin
MSQLRQDYGKFKQMNTEIVVLGPENRSSFTNYFQKEELPFIGIPDPHGSVLKLYGQEINLFKLGRMPAQVIIDMKGVVRFVHYGHSMSDIPPNEEILEILGQLDNT